MFDLKNKKCLMDSMDNSIEKFRESREYVKKEKRIDSSIGKLRKLLTREQNALFTGILDEIDENWLQFAYEAYFRGLEDRERFPKV